MVDRIKRRFRFLLLIGGVIMAVLCLEYLGLFAGIDTYFYDTFLRVRGERAVNDRIVIVAIDAKSLDSFGRWPISRRHYADMLYKLDQASVVAFDLLLTEPSADDTALAVAIKKQGRVLLPEYIDSDLNVVKPLERFLPHKSGHIHIELGVDNTAREVFHSIYSRDMLMPSISSLIYEMVASDRIQRNSPSLEKHGSSSGKVFQMNRHKINYYGVPGRFKQISLADVISNAVPPSYFKDKIVLVGLTAPGIVDEISTPLSQSRNRMSGVEVHAGIVNNLLDNSMIRDVPGWVRALTVFLISLLLYVFFLKQNEKNSVLIYCLSLLTAITSAAVLLFLFELWLTPTVYMVSFSAIFALTYLYRLDSAARKLDRERDVMNALLGWDSGAVKEQCYRNGLLGFMTEGGLNVKIQRQISMTSKLLNLHKQLEAALKIEREALDNQVRFVEMLSHEYRTPLAIIRANLDILEMKESRLGGDLPGNFAKMKRAMSRLVEVMDNSLGRDRIGETGLQVSRHEIELVSFVVKMVFESGELWSERRLEFGLKGGESCLVLGDSSMLKTALLNLIDNAIKYSSDAEPVFILLEIGERVVNISVRNRGALISEADQVKIFDKFYRGSGSGNTQGAGLGLYLVRKIIEQHNGAISISSSLSEGTVATVKLPLL